MKQKTGLFFIALLVVLAGCMPAAIRTTPITPEKTEIFKSFPYGKVMTRNVGAQMVGYNLKLLTNVYPGFVATSDLKLPSVGVGGVTEMPLIKKGSEWTAISQMEAGSYIIQNKNEPMMATFPMSTLWEVCLVVTEAGMPYGFADCKPTYSTYISRWKETLPSIFSPKKILEKELKARREASIVYGGKVGGTIKLIYQETALRNMEFVYDLSEGRDVAVKDIIFEILEASNTAIKYIIKTSPEELKSKIKEREKVQKELGADI